MDENIPSRTVETLRGLGHDVMDIRGTPLQGASDAEIWEIVQNEQRVLITTDKGFSGQHSGSHFGILIIRLRQPNEQQIHLRIIAALTHFPVESWRGLLVVMRDNVRSVSRR